MSTSVKIVETDGELGILLPKRAVRAFNPRRGDPLTLAELPEGLLLSPLDPEALRQLEIGRRIMAKR
jgi:bifunctional DNA-binding transcriptional regulator/antitoxin component of YhaV-PrlF toxin-antitoxin module